MIFSAENERSSQTVKAQLALREFILSGELKAGDRISELPMVERLGISRTPIRTALIHLAEEGLLETLPTGGFSVKAFTERDVFDAIEMRGTLEGMAARLAAERGVRDAILSELKELVARLDKIVGRDTLSVDDFSAYVDLNRQFHVVLLRAAESPLVERQVGRVVNLPFASPSAFLMVQATLPEARDILMIGQHQHRSVVLAMEMRKGERAESIMREHARLAHLNLQLAFRNKQTRDLVPGLLLMQE